MMRIKITFFKNWKEMKESEEQGSEDREEYAGDLMEFKADRREKNAKKGFLIVHHPHLVDDA